MTDEQKIEPRCVTLEVWRFKDKQPEITHNPLSDTVLVWMDEINPSTCVLWEMGDSAVWIDDREDEYPVGGTSWAYIPDIKEAT